MWWKKINETNFSTSKNINANTNILEPSKANKTTHTLMDQNDDLVAFNERNTPNILEPSITNSNLDHQESSPTKTEIGIENLKNSKILIILFYFNIKYFTIKLYFI